MIFIEDNLKWDAEKMKLVAHVSDPGSISFDDTWQLFRTENGRWGLLHVGEMKLIPLTECEAGMWLKKHNKVEAYELYFGELEEA